MVFTEKLQLPVWLLPYLCIVIAVQMAVVSSLPADPKTIENVESDDNLHIVPYDDDESVIVDANSNMPFEQLKQLEPQDKNDICVQPEVTGICKANMPRYWYNAKTGKCEFFRYGGCDGNKNNFASEELCIETCQEVRL